LSRESLKKQLDDIAEQLPLGLLHRLISDAQYFLDWYHSKKNLRRKWRGKKISNRFD